MLSGRRHKRSRCLYRCQPTFISHREQDRAGAREDTDSRTTIQAHQLRLRKTSCHLGGTESRKQLFQSEWPRVRLAFRTIGVRICPKRNKKSYKQKSFRTDHKPEADRLEANVSAQGLLVEIWRKEPSIKSCQLALMPRLASLTIFQARSNRSKSNPLDQETFRPLILQSQHREQHLEWSRQLVRVLSSNHRRSMASTKPDLSLEELAQPRVELGLVEGRASEILINRQTQGLDLTESSRPARIAKWSSLLDLTKNEIVAKGKTRATQFWARHR